MGPVLGIMGQSVVNISEDSTGPFLEGRPSANSNQTSNVWLPKTIQTTTASYKGSMGRPTHRSREYYSHHRSKNTLERETFELRYALVRAACVAHWLHQVRGKIPKEVNRNSVYTVILDMFVYLCEVDRKMASLDLDVYKIMNHDSEEAMAQFLSRAKFRSDFRYYDIYEAITSRRVRGQNRFYCYPEHESGIPSIREQLCKETGIRLVDRYVEILPLMLYKNDKREDKDLYRMLEPFDVTRRTAGELGITAVRWQARTMDRIVQEIDETTSSLEDFSDNEVFAEATGVTLHPNRSDRFSTPARTSTPEQGEILEVQRVEVNKKTRVKDSPDTEDMEVVEIQPAEDHVPVKGHDTRTAVNACMKLLLDMHKLQLELVTALQRVEISNKEHTAALQRLEIRDKEHTEEIVMQKECMKTVMTNQDVLKTQIEARMTEAQKNVVELTMSREQMQVLIPTIIEEMREVKKKLDLMKKEPLDRKNKVIESMKKSIEDQSKVIIKRDVNLEEAIKEMTNAKEINKGVKDEINRGMTKLQELQQAQGLYLQAQATKQEELSKKITRSHKETKEHAEGLIKKMTKLTETQHQTRIDTLSSCFSNLRTINEKVSKEVTTLSRMEEQTKQIQTSMLKNEETKLSKLQVMTDGQKDLKEAVISLQETQKTYQAKEISEKEANEKRSNEMANNQVIMLELLNKFQLVTPMGPTPGQPTGTLLIPAGEQQAPVQTNMSEEELLTCPTDEIIPGGNTDHITENERCWQEALALEGCYPPPSKSQRRDSTPTASANVGKIDQGEKENWTASVTETNMEQGRVAPIKIKREPGLDMDMINEISQIQPVRYTEPTGNK